jgi:uncharacterized protein (DUF1778 family)
MAEGIPTARLEARIPIHVFEEMQRAADLRGMTMTAFIISTAGEAARRTVEDAEILRLSREDQIRFAEALIRPPKPVSARWKRTAKLYAKMVEER